jgi:hypothetical protein
MNENNTYMYIKGREIAIGYIDYLVSNLDFDKI